jgi:hypothetical protein
MATSPNARLIALSDIADQRLTLRDLLPLLPAMLISLVFNASFVALLLFFNDSPTHASVSQKVKIGDHDLTGIPPDHDDPLDVSMEDIGPEKTGAPDQPIVPDTTDAADSLLAPPMPSDVKESPQTGFPGNDTSDPPGLPGISLENAVPGFLPGKDSGPLGEGPGLETLPGGPSMPGTWNSRRNPDAGARRGGGSDASQQAVAQGLVWLSRHQNPAGYWSLDKYHQGVTGCRCKDLNFEADVFRNDTAGTALGLLPFLAAGHTHTNEKARYKTNVFNGLRYLLTHQDANGDLGGGMYAHGIATMALCEAYGMTKDQKLRPAAQNAIKFIVAAQNPLEGSWRYTPRSADGDVSVVAWQIMALRSGQMSGLEVDAKALEKARDYLALCSGDGGAKYAYQPGAAVSHPITAAALLGRQYLGWGPRNPALLRGCDYLLEQLPPAAAAPNQKLGPLYFYYYASQVMHNMDGKYWETWNPRMREFLIRTQEQDGCKKGSWDPDGCDWGKNAGRVYSTSLSILTLEVYYRYLPLYNRDKATPQEEMKNEAPKKD